jgi:hypothetical protein
MSPLQEIAEKSTTGTDSVNAFNALERNCYPACDIQPVPIQASAAFLRQTMPSLQLFWHADPN